MNDGSFPANPVGGVCSFPRPPAPGRTEKNMQKSPNVETSKSPNEGTEGASYRDRAVQFVSCAGTDGELRTVRIAPWGRTQSKSGEFVIDDEAASMIFRAFEDHATAVPIDIEHETLDASVPPGQRAGAVGWIEKLWPEPGKGLMGLVKWSERGRGLIRSDAFRFLSPVFAVRKSDRRASRPAPGRDPVGDARRLPMGGAGTSSHRQREGFYQQAVDRGYEARTRYLASRAWR
jgi:hypothetical protein